MTAVPELNLNPIPPSDQYLDALLSQDVAALQLVLKRHPSDPLVKFSLASALEKAGDLPGAIALYQELAAAEPPGLVSSSARKALAALPGEPAVGDSPPAPPQAIPSAPGSATVGETAPGEIALGVTPTQHWQFGRRQKAIARGLDQLQTAAQQFLAGDHNVRIWDLADPQLGFLAQAFNAMANQITTLTLVLAEQERQQQALAIAQEEERSRLQESVINLLLDIEGAQRGDLTVRAKVDAGEMGSIADAFNATVRSLREIVFQVKAASNQVQAAAFSSESSVEKLSEEAKTQAQVVTAALNSVAEMGESIHSVAESAQEAAAIARQVLEVSQEGSQTMDQTVGSIENIRTSVAETSKKMKRLAESSQEISKIVNIISNISEKTNLLAFNARLKRPALAKTARDSGWWPMKCGVWRNG